MAGAGWDRDSNAGIENRTVVYAGVDNPWRDDDHLRFKTDYAITYTRRIDEIEDPERDANLSEVRLSWEYMHQFVENTRFDSDFIFFVYGSDASDNRFNTITRWPPTSLRSWPYVFRFSCCIRTLRPWKRSTCSISTRATVASKSDPPWYLGRSWTR